MRTLLILMTLFLVTLCSSCDEPATSGGKTADERWVNTAAWIERQIERPSSVAGGNRSTPFYVDQYVPRLKKAAERLPLLKEGRIKSFTVASYVRPLAERGWVLWILWVRTDDKPRTAVLSDAEGELVTFQVPLPDPDPNTANFIEFEVIEIYTGKPAAPSPDDGRPAGRQFETPRALTEVKLRIFDPSAPGEGEDELVKVVPIPGPDEMSGAQQ